MKRILLSLSLLLTTVAAMAQVPQGINYQAVMRDGAGMLIASQTVALRISIIQGGSATSVYQETHTTTTNQFGLVNLTIGFGTPVQGSFSAIDWANGPYSAQIEADINGGSAYVLFGSQQLMSVPYALYAESSGQPGTPGATGPTGADGVQGPQGATGPTGPQGLLSQGSVAGLVPFWNGTSWVTTFSNIYSIGNNVGIGTTSPSVKLEVNGVAANSSALNAGTSGTIDFSVSNIAHTGVVGTSFTLSNLKDGGAYSLILTSTSNTGIASFTSGGFTFHYMGTIPMRIGKTHIYSFIVAGTNVYVSMATQN